LLSLPLDWNEWWMGSLRSRCALWTWGHWISVQKIDHDHGSDLYSTWWWFDFALGLEQRY
jgi:hypothetical protein